jgi:hypothetical protein
MWQNTKFEAPGIAGASAPAMPRASPLLFCHIFWSPGGHPEALKNRFAPGTPSTNPELAYAAVALGGGFSAARGWGRVSIRRKPLDVPLGVKAPSMLLLWVLPSRCKTSFV